MTGKSIVKQSFGSYTVQTKGNKTTYKYTTSRRSHRDRKGDSNSEDEFNNDNVGVISGVADTAQPLIDNPDEVPSNERYEEKFLQALEDATEKSAQTRVLALQKICEIMMYCFMPDFVEGRKETLIDIIEKAIRRGKGAEQVWGARLAPLLVLQLGGDDTVCKAFNQLLLNTVQNESVAFDARAKCCTALGLLTFLGDENADLLTVMQSFEGIFSGSYLSGDDKTPVSVKPDAATLHAEALSAWGLLLTLVPSSDFVSWMSNGSIKKIMGLLQSPHLDVRIAAGETLALILECGREHDDSFFEKYLGDLIDAVKQLATDSHKYRAKRDRKTQRATFRDVLHYLKDNISPDINIRFGTECLVLDSWAVYQQYSSLCAVMGPGINSHLQENEFMRDIFELGPKIKLDQFGDKKSTLKIIKFRKHFKEVIALKARTKVRGKDRAERSAVKT